MKKFMFAASLFLCSFLLGQNSSLLPPARRLDSLWAVYRNTEQADTNRLNAIHLIARSYTSNKSDTAIILAEQERQLAVITGQKKFEARALNSLGASFNLLGNYPKAMEYFLQSLKLNETAGNKNAIGACYRNIGLVYQNLSEYPKAIDYYLKSLKIDEETGSKRGMAACYTNIGNIYDIQADYSKALQYQLNALKIRNEIGDKEGMGSCYLNLGNIYCHKSEYSKGLEYYLKALKISKETDNKRAMGICYNSMSGYYKKLSNFRLAVQYGDSCLQLTKLTGDINAARLSNQNLAEAYAKTGLFEEAYNHYIQFKILTDSIYNKDKIKQLGDLKTNFEVEKKETEIRLEEQQKLEEKNYWIAGSLGLLLLGIIASIAFYTYFKQRQLLVLQENIVLEQKMLRSQMNPHFIFNSLAAINTFIEENKTEEASDYLVKFSRLTRLILSNSRREYITLSEEISTLNYYLELQNMLFEKTVRFQVQIDEKLDKEKACIPPMLAQPFIENSLKHGLKNKNGVKEIAIRLLKNENTDSLVFEIQDNGTGWSNTKNNTNSEKGNHESFAIKITEERLANLNKNRKEKINIYMEEIKDAEGNISGTLIKFTLPYLEC